jgi:hypothetical protein
VAGQQEFLIAKRVFNVREQQMVRLQALRGLDYEIHRNFNAAADVLGVIIDEARTNPTAQALARDIAFTVSAKSVFFAFSVPFRTFLILILIWVCRPSF